MKYELMENVRETFGVRVAVFRIKALKDFGSVKAGDLGGWIESEKNLSQEGQCWVSDDAYVSGDAHVSGNAWVSEDAHVSSNACISDEAWIRENAYIDGNVCIKGAACVDGDAHVSGNVCISDDAWVTENAQVSGDAQVSGNAYISKKCVITPKSLFSLKWNVTIMDEEMRIGCECHTFDSWTNFTDKEINGMNENALEFWKENKEMLMTMCNNHNS